MMAADVEVVIDSFRRMAESWQAGVTVERIRQDVDTLYSRMYPADCRYSTRELNANGVPCREVRAEDAGSGTILYLHGGGFSTGSVSSHTPIAARISNASKATVIVVGYRLAPEFSFPAAHDDALNAYRWLIGCGQSARQIAVAGDSSGGGMALALLQMIRDVGLSQPACGVLLSPWADLACSGPSYFENASTDPITSRDMALQMATGYLGESADLHNPAASPVYGSFSGLPPLLIDVGSREIFLDDSRAVAEAARKAGVPVTYTEWPEMIHVFHLFAGRIEAGQKAIGKIGEFVRGSFQTAK